MEMNVRAAGMRGFDALMAALGVDFRPLLAAVGISESALHDEEERVSLRAYARLLENAVVQTGRDDLGLRMAEYQDVSILGPLAIAMQNAATVGEAVELCSRYLYTHSPGIRLSLHPLQTGQGAPALANCALRMNLVLPSWWPQTQLMEQCLADLHHFVAMLAGSPDALNDALLGVQFTHARCTQAARYIDVFGRPVEFSCAHTQLVVSGRFLGRSMAGVSDDLHRLSLDYLQLAFAPQEATLTERVEDVLRRALSSTRGRRDVVARLLDLHPRTLQRRLRDEGVAFSELVDKARREQARQWLTASQLPLIQVAGAVGLADQAVLSRNCRRWFGCTPLQLRAGRGADAGAPQKSHSSI